MLCCEKTLTPVTCINLAVDLCLYYSMCVTLWVCVPQLRSVNGFHVIQYLRRASSHRCCGDRPMV